MLRATPMRDAEECPCSRELRPRKPGGHGALLAGAQDRGCMQGQICPPHSPQAILSSSGRSASLRHAERTRAYRKRGGCCIPLPPQHRFRRDAELMQINLQRYNTGRLDPERSRTRDCPQRVPAERGPALRCRGARIPSALGRWSPGTASPQRLWGGYK